MNKRDWESFQHEANRWVVKYLDGVAKLRVDGEPGVLTRRRIESIKRHLGYGPKQLNGHITQEFLNRMRNVHADRFYPSKSMMRRGMRRRKAQRRAYKLAKLATKITPGVTMFDGKPVAKAAVPILKWCRAHGWRGVVVSGWRSIPYSISLCFRICRRSSCPGRCAGASTNHVGKTAARFAVDVSWYQQFAVIVARCPIKPRIFNALGARDPVHFSPSGR